MFKTGTEKMIGFQSTFAECCLAGLIWALAMGLLLDRLVCYLKRLGFPKLKLFVLRISLVAQLV